MGRCTWITDLSYVTKLFCELFRSLKPLAVAPAPGIAQAVRWGGALSWASFLCSWIFQHSPGRTGRASGASLPCRNECEGMMLQGCYPGCFCNFSLLFVLQPLPPPPQFAMQLHNRIRAWLDLRHIGGIELKTRSLTQQIAEYFHLLLPENVVAYLFFMVGWERSMEITFKWSIKVVQSHFSAQHGAKVKPASQGCIKGEQRWQLRP